MELDKNMYIEIIILITIWIFCCYRNMKKSTYIASLEEQLSLQITYFSIVQKSIDECKMIKHGLKNDFIAINYMLDNGDVEKGKLYINKLNHKVDEIVILNYTSNTLIESILYGYKTKLDELNIDLIANIKISRELNNQLKYMGQIMIMILNSILKVINYSTDRRAINIEITKNNSNYCFSININQLYKSRDIKKIKFLIELLRIKIGKKYGLIDIVSNRNYLEIRYIGKD